MPRKIQFRVVHVSGEDENFRAAQLNTHSLLVQGWQSPRFCLYPQEIVIQLETRCHLRKIQILSHQFLIASKVEFFIGDIPDGRPTSLQNVQYARLGYVSLSDNEKTEFKARELKSVTVDTICSFLKIVIHKNHINKFNLYNQVGIVAVNVIGDAVTDSNFNKKDQPCEFENSFPVSNNPETLLQQGLIGPYSRPDYISPLDDLAFDMYQDAEVAQIIRKLESKKQEAVVEERFDYAKKLKQAIIDLQKAGEKLGRFEVEKRQAIELEDYDKAQLKKVQMEEYRLQVYQQLELYNLLEMRHTYSSGEKLLIESPRNPLHQKLYPMREVTSPSKQSFPSQTPLNRQKVGQSISTPSPSGPLPSTSTCHSRPLTPLDPEIRRYMSPILSSYQAYEERPLPALKNTHKGTKPMEYPIVTAKERLSPTAIAMVTVKDDMSFQNSPQSLLESVSENERREATLTVEIFGQPMVANIFAKSWSLRDEALLSMNNIMTELSSSIEAKETLKGSIFMLQKGLKDNVASVSNTALKVLRMILTEFISNHKVPKSDVIYLVDKTLPCLLSKTGDLASRSRTTAQKFILEMAEFPEIKPLHLVPSACCKPLKSNMAPRLALSRSELVEQLLKQLKLEENSGLCIDQVMKFCTTALSHNSGEVREVSERIIVALYREVGSQVKKYLPPDDEVTRKNILYKHLFEAFDKVHEFSAKEIVPPCEELKIDKLEITQKENIAKEEVKEVKIKETKKMNPAAAPKTNKNKKSHSASVMGIAKDKSSNVGRTISRLNIRSESVIADEEDASSVYNTDLTCVFCGETNENFNEEGLDLHFWKHCPMLRRCIYCKQVIEIAGLTEHLLTECDTKEDFTKCPKCLEAILKVEQDKHKKTCIQSKPEKIASRCPLCHLDIPPGEEGWRNHLMGVTDACVNNIRNTNLKIQNAEGTSKANNDKIEGKKPLTNKQPPEPKTTTKKRIPVNAT